MPQLIGHHGTYPPSQGWDLVKLKSLAFKPMEGMPDDEAEYLQMWLQTEQRAAVMGRLSEWEAEDANRNDNIEAEKQRRDDRPVGKALYYKPGDIEAGRVNPDDVAR